MSDIIQMLNGLTLPSALVICVAMVLFYLIVRFILS